ncbi:HET domain-containing protein [Fusarium sp. LHS14.1]|nr:HET domain-containing protein [Fusarium sp. LHS14.1]
MDTKISYHSLDDPDRSFRLIKLQPSKDNETATSDNLVCDIEEHVRGDCPPYTALSYVWATPESKREYVIANGNKVQISQTVENALRRLRFRQKPRWLWVDQLCINQVDENEKSHQVHQMHSIYSDADQVISWLGTGDEKSHLICRLMRDTGRALRQRDMDALRKLYGEEGSVDLVAAKEAFHAFCERRYWTRLWVIQEFAVGRRVAVACGDWIVKSELITATLWAVDTLRRHSHKKPIEGLDIIRRNYHFVFESPLSSYVYNLFTRRALFRPPSRDTESSYPDRLLKVIATSLTLEVDYNSVFSSEPRDRVFALLNLAADKDHFDTFPDYSMSVEQVYKEAARKMLLQGDIDVLLYCQTPKKIESLPSWVPDWAMEVRHPCAQPPWSTCFDASGGYTLTPTFPSDDIVALEGIYIDTIKETGEPWDPDWLKKIDKAAVSLYIESIRGFCNRSPRIHVGREGAETSRIAILDGTLWFDSVPYPEWGTECEAALDEFLQSLANGDESIISDPWYSASLLRLHGRRAFLTSTGYVGVGPLDTRVGDEVCVFIGGNAAYLVRPEENELYSLIGEAYVHGVMYGELLKGDFEQRKLYTLR